MPLVVSEGAGAEMRRTLGTAVFAGMLGVTMFGIFLTPVFFYVIQWFADWRESGASQSRTCPQSRTHPNTKRRAIPARSAGKGFVEDSLSALRARV